MRTTVTPPSFFFWLEPSSSAPSTPAARESATAPELVACTCSFRIRFTKRGERERRDTAVCQSIRYTYIHVEKQKSSVDDCATPRVLSAIRRWSGDTYYYTATLVGDGRSFRHLAPRERIIARRTGPPVLRLGVSARLVAAPSPLPRPLLHLRFFTCRLLR